MELDRTSLQRAVHETVLGVARTQQAALSTVRNVDKLVDLGLQSLDLAKIVAKLELSTGLDPFMELVSITSVRTVGDLYAAYVSAMEGSGPPSEEQSVPSGLDRAARRRGAGNS